MITKKTTYLILFLSFFVSIINAQQRPTLIINSEPVQKVPSLASRKYLPLPVKKGEINKKRHSGQNIIVPGKGFPKGDDPLLISQNRSPKISHKSKAPDLTFEASNQGVSPSDPTGAVGPNHYVMAYNTGFKIFDKNGNVLINDTALHAIFQGTNDDGDPIVMYDKFADRFIVTEFDLSSTPKKLMIAISQGADPVNSGWNVYKFDVDAMPDYPKYSIWSDGYYVTANKSNPSQNQVVFAMERDKMIAGDNTAQMIGFNLPGISINGFYSPAGFNVLGNQLPPAGNAPIIYLQDDAWSGVSDDHLKIWNINVDWNTPTNSTISTPQQIVTSDFNSVFNGGHFQNLPQPNGTDIDALQATMMYMTNYRRFSDHNSVVLNFVVKGVGNKAAIRWYELRQNNDGDPWAIYQEGTYADASGHHTFAGSISMDKFGNIALGYTITDSNQPPELKYTGRFSTDPLGQMTINAETIVPGVQSSPVYRYGDYSQLTVDPTYDKTFWFIGEYFNNNHRIDQVAVFSFAQFNNDVGVIDLVNPVSAVLSNNETVTVKIRNFGTQSAGNFPVSYQIDGGAVVTENYTGTLASGAETNFTFSTTGDFSNTGHSYSVIASTNLSGDEDTSNDAQTFTVKHLLGDDVGITNITSPTSSSNIGNNETVTVTIKNFGGNTQTNIPVSYTLDNGTPVNETFTGNLTSNSEANYSFTTTGDFSALGNHQISATTNLSGDQDNTNDVFSTTVNKTMCQPVSNCSDGDEISHLIFSNLDTNPTCVSGGYIDNTSMIANLSNGNAYPMTISTNYGNDHLTAWVDFNDNFVFDSNEKIIDNETIGSGGGSGPHTETINTILPTNMPLGQHLMRLKLYWNQNPSDPCADMDYGQTQDYTVNVTNTSGINELQDANFVLQTIDKNHFIARLTGVKTNDEYTLKVFDISGQILVNHYLKKYNGEYTYDLDMSYVSKGVYLLRIGNNKAGIVRRIIIK